MLTLWQRAFFFFLHESGRVNHLRNVLCSLHPVKRLLIGVPALRTFCTYCSHLHLYRLLYMLYVLNLKQVESCCMHTFWFVFHTRLNFHISSFSVQHQGMASGSCRSYLQSASSVAIIWSFAKDEATLIFKRSIWRVKRIYPWLKLPDKLLNFHSGCFISPNKTFLALEAFCCFLHVVFNTGG